MSTILLEKDKCIYSAHEACEGNGVGRNSQADGDVDACINYQKDKNISFAVVIIRNVYLHVYRCVIM